ncbi:MAG: hypothetical protein KDD56_00510 [Bdellovibrionales bacterium]|nr:hypothetical protein [Bdellovibrionales bacterium]
MPRIPKEFASLLQVAVIMLAVFVSLEYKIDSKILSLILFVIAFLILFIRALKIRSFDPESFARFPQNYNKEFIEVSGKIVRIFEDSIFEKVKRKAVDKYRDSIGDPNPKGRYSHQRFLIKSDEIYPGETILIEHNENFGRLNIQRGDKVLVKGEYIHTKNFRHRYGRIHKTHPPLGWIRVN